MLNVDTESNLVFLHDPNIELHDLEHHVRKASTLANVVFLLTRSDADLSDQLIRNGLNLLVAEVAKHASAVEYLLLDAPKAQ